MVHVSSRGFVMLEGVEVVLRGRASLSFNVAAVVDAATATPMISQTRKNRNSPRR